MSLKVNHNIAAINAHRNLLVNDVNQSKTLEKLSSGLKINRAAEGPAALVISEHMRAQILGVNQAIDNSETAISMIQTSEANLGEINNLLVSMRQLAIHAANDGVNDEYTLSADQNEIFNALNTIDRITEQAQFGNKKMLDGSMGAAGTTTGKNLEFISATVATADSREKGFAVDIIRDATKTHLSGSVALTQGIINAGEKLTVIENGKMAEYTTKENDTVDTAIANLRAEIVRKGLEVNIDINTKGVIELSHQRFGSEDGFQVSSTTAGVLGGNAGEVEVAIAGEDIVGLINGESAIGKGQILTGLSGAECVDGLSVRYYGDGKDEIKPGCTVNDLEEPVDPAVAKAQSRKDEEAATEEARGNNPKRVGRVFVSQNSMHFQVGGNLNQTVGISIKGTNTDQLSRGVANMSDYKNLRDIDVTTFQGAQDSLKLIDHAIDQMTNTRGELGTFQKNTLESNFSNLRVANQNLISSESVIRDVDMAKEMANYTRNQIMSQSGTAMLAQANQVQNNVLQLLG